MPRAKYQLQTNPPPKDNRRGFAGATPYERVYRSLTTKEHQALEYRRAGYTYKQINEFLGRKPLSEPSTIRLVRSALQKTVLEPAEEARTLECERLDMLLQAVWSQAMKGDNWSIDRALQIMDRRSRILGLDAPQKIRVEVITQEAVDRAIHQQQEQYARLVGIAESRGLNPPEIVDVESEPVGNLVECADETLGDEN